MSEHKKIYFLLAIIGGVLSFVFVSSQWVGTTRVQEMLSATIDVAPSQKQEVAVILEKKRQKPERREVKGIYLTAYSAGSSQTIDRFIDLIERTELNAVVIDTKDYSGKVLYDSAVPLVDEFSLEDDRLGDIAATIQKLHEHDIYVIARQTVFQDPILAEKKSEWAIKSKNGGLWRDHKGLAWVDPTRTEVWEYNVAIAKESIELGFDEINFDYVRFPSDGNMSLVVYTNGETPRNDVMGEFYAYLNEELKDEPAYTSLDLFGFVMERHDGLSIGQTLLQSIDEVDYISPMMYPSHYPVGHLGFTNPAEHAGRVIENGMQKGAPYFASSTRTEVRPWIQAFDIGADYRDGIRIREQIDAVEAYTEGGWLLWDARNVYTSAGLKVNE
jgi:hypothetical protein